MSMVKVTVLLAIAWGSVACGPSLRTVQSDTSWWTSSQACAQGPFDLSWQAKGLRWGEGVQAQVFSDHAFVANWRLELGGHRLKSGVIKTRARQAFTDRKGQRRVRYVRDRQADTRRCQPGANDHGPVVSVSAGHAQVSVSTDARPHSNDVEVAPVAGELQAAATFIAASPVRDRKHHVRFLNWRHSDPRSSGGTRLPKGGTLTLRVWSEQPQDWRHVAVRLVTLELRPDVPEAEFIAHLKIKEQARAEQRRERRLAAQERSRRGTRTQRANVGASDRLAVSPQQRTAQRRRAARWRILAAERTSFNKTRRYFRTTTTPNGPPPRPYDEVAPPRPATHAQWVAGQWRWEGRQWQWWHGWWKLPLRSRVAVRAVAGRRAPSGHGFTAAIHTGPCQARIGLRIGQTGGYIALQCQNNARSVGRRPQGTAAPSATRCARSSTSCRQQRPPKRR
jgi:hypothetical protein